MKQKIFSLLVLLLTAVSGAWATEVTIGDQNSTVSENKLPVNTLYNYFVTQQIYTAGEIGMGGYISAISFYYDHVEAFSMSGIQIFMKHVTKSAFSSITDVEAISASDKVFEGTLAATTTGWVTITLDTPFEYDGTSNLLVCCYDATIGYPGSLYKFKQTNTATNQALSYHSDSYVPDVYDMSNYSGNKYIYDNRSNIKLEIGASASYALTKATDAEAHGSIVFKVDGKEVTTAAKGKTVNVEIKADDDWTVGTPSGIWYAAEAKARQRRAQTDIDIEKEFNLTYVSTDANTGVVTYKFTMIAANAEISCTYKKNLQDAWIQDIDAVDYTGSALTPAVTVIDGETTLTEGTDYTVEYSNNVKAAKADATENAPTVTITGIGDNYAGTATATFTINPRVTEIDGIEIVETGELTEFTITETTNDPCITLPENLEMDILNYSRQLDESEDAYTTCMATTPPTADYLHYYTLTGSDETTLFFDEIEGNPQALTPYLVVADKTTIVSRTANNVTLSKTVANQSSAGNYVLKGTLSGINHDDAIGLYILQSGNRWGVIVADKTEAYVPPFRAYIEATSASARKTLGSNLGDNTTGLQNIRTTDKDGTERWFDLNGHRIEKPATKGVYIQDGRKILVK